METIVTVNVDWVNSIILKSHQVSFSIYFPTLFNLFVDLTIVYFLIQKENVYSAGENYFGSLVLGHITNQNELDKISNIPPIKIISCVGTSCYLIDFEGNLWSFGYNYCGQLGHGDTTNINTPKLINTLKDNQQISYGCTGEHFIAKNSQNQIFTTGNNNHGITLKDNTCNRRYTQFQS